MVMTTPATLRGSTVGSSTQAGTRVVDGLAEVLRAAAPGGELGGDGREDVAAVEGGARALHTDAARAAGCRRARCGIAGARPTTGASRPLSGARNNARRRDTATMLRAVPTPGSTTATCTVPRREVAERARQPEPGLGRPVHQDLVGQVDDARRRQAR